MIENLTVENYRSFQNYSMNNLKRVNLLTGLNNSGKTSLLEAVEILASGGEPAHLLRISERRDEHVILDPELKQPHGDPTQFFHMRDFGKCIGIRSEQWKVTLEFISPTSNSDGDDQEALRISREGSVFGSPTISVEFGEDGTFGSWNRRTRWGGSPLNYESFCSVEFLGLKELMDWKVASRWDRILIAKAEREPVYAMQILDPMIESIVYLTSGSRRGRIYVGKKGEDNRTPIGSHGDGMQRILAISISLATVKGGILLVDEIDTGLHYSVLADMWKLVIGTAIKNDIQVFATTHSQDCLRGLNEACQSNPEYAAEVSTQTIDRSLPVSISGDATDLRSAIDLGIEVR